MSDVTRILRLIERKSGQRIEHTFAVFGLILKRGCRTLAFNLLGRHISLFNSYQGTPSVDLSEHIYLTNMNKARTLRKVLREVCPPDMAGV